MTTLKRLLLATTILTSAMGLASAAPQNPSRIIVAQQAAPEPEMKPDAAPPAKPVPKPAAPAAKPAPAPAAKPAPAPAQPQRPAAPPKPTPPAAQTPPAAAQPRKPDQPPPPAARQPRPPAAQTPPTQRRDAPQRPASQTPPPPSQPQPKPSVAPSQTAPGTQTPPPRREDIKPEAPTPRVLPQQPAAPTPPPATQDRRSPSGQQGAPAPSATPQTPAGQPAPQQSQTPATPSGQPSTAAQPRRIEDVRGQRREEKQRDGRTVIREGDRTIVRQGDRTIIRRDESDRFRGRGGRDVRVERRGNENFTIVARPGGGQIVTVTDADGRLIRRTRRDARGREVVIIDNRSRGPRRAGGFFIQLPPPVIRIPRERYIVEAEGADEALIYETLIAPPVERIERGYTLDEVRYSPELRDRMRRVDVDTITFDTGSWEITQDQVNRLAPIADAIKRAVERNPNEVFLIEGHTDAVGADVDNLSLSDRRAESVANLLTDEFQVPPENLTTQGYGEEYLKIPTDGPERQNRRVTARRITPLLTGQNAPPAPR